MNDEESAVPTDAPAPVPPSSLHYTMHVPIDRPGRPRLRDRIALTGDKLASKAARFTTMAQEYAKRRTFARDMENPPSRPPPSLFTVQRRAHPAAYFNGLYGIDSLAEYVAQFEQNAGLLPVPLAPSRP